MNQTTQMHQIAQQLPECESFFSPHYCDPPLSYLVKHGMAEWTVVGSGHVSRCLKYLEDHKLSIDIGGKDRGYDLVVTCSDLVLPRNIRKKPIVLVQEGMTDPENFAFHMVRKLRFLPRWIASTSTTGLSDGYVKFCVASDGYRELFIQKGVDPKKIVVTGIPNFDNCARFRQNNFAYKHFVLVCTSDARETCKYENRKKTIREALRIADGRLLIFKLHPNENRARAEREIKAIVPNALVFARGSAEEMIANCDVLITSYSSTVYVGVALHKEVHSRFRLEHLRKLMPVQNGCAALNIANVCREVLSGRLIHVANDDFPRIAQLVGAV